MAQNEFNPRRPSVNVHKFAMIPRAEIPRSQFRMQHTHKTTFPPSLLIPVFVQEILPGDSLSLHMTAFSRMQTPIVPIMDNMRLDSFFFFVPNRLVWKNWAKFMGEQDNPGDSTSFAVPTVTSPTGGFPVGSIADYFGLPTVGQVGSTGTVTVNVLPIRAYYLIWHQWFRDENLQNGVFVVGGTSTTLAGANDSDGPDSWATQYGAIAPTPGFGFGLLARNKRHDYFTSCLPFAQKGNPVGLPLIGTAPVVTGATNHSIGTNPVVMGQIGSSTPLTGGSTLGIDSTGSMTQGGTAPTGGDSVGPINLFADLSAATATTINAIRLAFQTQKLLERDARGGTRYTEIIRSHFGVLSPDSRLQRAEYLGGGTSPVNITPVAQTSATVPDGAAGSTPLGNLAAIGTNVTRGHGFRQSFTEHGYVIGLTAITADLSYQQGLRKLWSRSTRFDFYFPVFAALGEQAVLNQEIFCQGDTTGANDDGTTFGFQERWAEYRYFPSMITGQFRSTSAGGTLDFWHLSQRFNSLPTLNASFITDSLLGVLPRNLAGGQDVVNESFIADFFFDMKFARPMPMYSVPGLIDHF